MKAAILLTAALSIGLLTYFAGDLWKAPPGQSSVEFDGVAAYDSDRPAVSPADTVQIAFVMCSQRVRTDCVTDGDTIQIQEQTIRIADIDAPEVNASICAAEEIKGKQASQRLMELLNAAPFSLSVDGLRDQDQHDRKLRLVTRHNKSLGEILVAEGLAHAWAGAKYDWCA